MTGGFDDYAWCGAAWCGAPAFDDGSAPPRHTLFRSKILPVGPDPARGRASRRGPDPSRGRASAVGPDPARSTFEET